MCMCNAKEEKNGTHNLLWTCMYAMYRELENKKFCKGIFCLSSQTLLPLPLGFLLSMSLTSGWLIVLSFPLTNSPNSTNLSCWYPNLSIIIPLTVCFLPTVQHSGPSLLIPYPSLPTKTKPCFSRGRNRTIVEISGMIGCLTLETTLRPPQNTNISGKSCFTCLGWKPQSHSGKQFLGSSWTHASLPDNNLCQHRTGHRSLYWTCLVDDNLQRLINLSDLGRFSQLQKSNVLDTEVTWPPYFKLLKMKHQNYFNSKKTMFFPGFFS